MKDKKLIVLLAIIAAYYVLTHINVARVLGHAIERPSRTSPFGSKVPQPIPPTTLPKQEEIPIPTVPAFQQLAPLIGVWAGKGVLKEKGMCTIRIDLRASPPNRFTGYSSLSCIAFDSVMKSITKGGASPNEAVFGRLAPTSTILSGEAQNGAIILHTEKSLGTAGDDCTVTEIALTPFSDQLAAEWKENKCQGGQLVMVRAAQ